MLVTYADISAGHRHPTRESNAPASGHASARPRSRHIGDLEQERSTDRRDDWIRKLELGSALRGMEWPVAFCDGLPMFLHLGCEGLIALLPDGYHGFLGNACRL